MYHHKAITRVQFEVLSSEDKWQDAPAVFMMAYAIIVAFQRNAEELARNDDDHDDRADYRHFRTVACIKAIRDATGWGLRHSKKFVEEMKHDAQSHNPCPFSHYLV